MPNTLGDGPIQEEYRALMNQIAASLDKVFNGDKKEGHRTTGFVLLVFPYDDHEGAKNRCNFISNGADRKDIALLFKEMIARFEGQPAMKGHA